MMDYSHYLEKQNIPIGEPAKQAHKFAICIPAHLEKDVEDTLSSLAHNIGVDYSQFVIYLCFNHSESDEGAREIHLQQEQKLRKKLESFPFTIHILQVSMPVKKAGVGYARKFAMDTAIAGFQSQNIKDGYLIALDADCIVSENYLSSIANYFSVENAPDAASIYFRHQRKELFPGHKRAIMKYEMHLRLYRMWQQYMGHPYANHTVGSAMVCSANAYVKQGGMNTKKAGEDFYFLNKLMHLGSFGNITQGMVYPQSRISERVPFGTGRAMLHASEGSEIRTYNPDIFFPLKWLFLEMRSAIPNWEKLSPENQFVIENTDLLHSWNIVNANTTSADNFKKRLFQTFDLFQLMKMVHLLRDNFFPNVLIEESYFSYCQLFSKKSQLSLEKQYEHIFKLDKEAIIEMEQSEFY